MRVGATGLGFSLHNDIVAPYLVDLTNDEQKERWLPGFASGELITAIAMTEPAAGSDLQGIRTTAIRDGDHYVVNGSKTFITNGINADLVVTVTKTDPAKGAKGMTLLVVERGMEGFTRGRNLEKIGMKAQDTAELFFDNVRVPVANRLGDAEGQGFYQLMRNLPQERLSIAVGAVAAAETVLEQTIEYCRTRKAFGQSIGKFQNTQFVLAELATEVEIARHYVDKCIMALNAGELTADRRREGEVVDDRAAEQGRRPLPAAARRLRLHARVPGRQGVPRRPGAEHLRRHERDHEGDHRPLLRLLTRPAGGRPPGRPPYPSPAASARPPGPGRILVGVAAGTASPSYRPGLPRTGDGKAESRPERRAERR